MKTFYITPGLDCDGYTLPKVPVIGDVIGVELLTAKNLTTAAENHHVHVFMRGAGPRQSSQSRKAPGQ